MHRIEVIKADITKLTVDAIVNAANSRLAVWMERFIGPPGQNYCKNASPLTVVKPVSLNSPEPIAFRPNTLFTLSVRSGTVVITMKRRCLPRATGTAWNWPGKMAPLRLLSRQSAAVSTVSPLPGQQPSRLKQWLISWPQIQRWKE